MPVDLNNLNGPQRKIVRDAFVAAYDLESFRMFLDGELDKQLANLVDEKAAFEVVVFELIKKSQKQGWTEQMIVRAENTSGNARIATLRQTIETSAAIDVPSVERQVMAKAPKGGGLERLTKQGGFVDLGLWVARMTQIGRQVCRLHYPLDLKTAGGTAFLVSPDLILTNYHVIEHHQKGELNPAGITCLFDFAVGRTTPPVSVRLAKEWLVTFSPYSSYDPGDRGGLPPPEHLDYALLRLERPVGEDLIDGAKRGWLDLAKVVSVPAQEQVIFILQHPQLEPLKMTVGSVIKANENGTRLRYDASTENGSSGSPCLDAGLNVVALHHGGDPDYTHLAEFNQGIPITHILKHMGREGSGVPKFWDSPKPLENTSEARDSQNGNEENQQTRNAYPLIGREEIFGEIFGWIGKKVKNNKRRLLIRGETGVGRTAILETINDSPDQDLESAPKKFKSVSVECKTPSEVSDVFRNFVENMASEFGYARRTVSQNPDLLETLARLLKQEPYLVLLDDFHDLYKRLNDNEKTTLDALLGNGFSKSFVIATSNQAEDQSVAMWSKFKRQLDPLTYDQMLKLYEKFCGDLGWRPNLPDDDLQKLIKDCKGLPKLLEVAVHEHWLKTQSSKSVVVRWTFEEEWVVAAWHFAPSRDQGIVEYLCRLIIPDLDIAAVLKSLQKRYPELKVPIQSVPQLLLADGKSLLQSKVEMKAAFQSGLRKWAADFISSSPMWEREESQYTAVERHQDDLKHAADLDLDLPTEKRTIPAEHLITITRIIHHFGAWDIAARLMEKALPESTSENRISLWLLLARHHSYRGEDDEANKWLEKVEMAVTGKPELAAAEVQLRLRRGQSTRRTDPQKARADLQYVMDQGTVYDYLVSAGFVAEMHLDKRGYSEARRILETAMSLQKDLIHPWERIRAHHNRQLGEIAAKHGEWHAAKQYFQTAIAGSRWAADQRLLGWAKLGMALCSCHEDDAIDALKYLEPLGNVASRELERAQGLLRYIRSCNGATPAPIILAGGPGAGKTTLRTRLACWLVEKGIPVHVTGIEEAQRALYPPLNLLNQPYEYDAAGALILNERDTQIPLAYDALAHFLKHPPHPCAVPLIECAHPNLVFAFQRIGSEYLRNGCVLMLDVPVDIRLKRNEEREKRSRVPEEVVRTFDSPVDDSLRAHLKEIGATLTVLQGTQSEDQVFAEAQEAIKNHRKAWFQADPGTNSHATPQ